MKICLSLYIWRFFTVFNFEVHAVLNKEIFKQNWSEQFVKAKPDAFTFDANQISSSFILFFEKKNNKNL